MKIVTNDMVIKMNEMYSEGKNLRVIGNLMNISPYTARKYIKNYKEEFKDKKIFNIPLPDFNIDIFLNDNWGELTVLSEKETEEVRKLWEEIEF